MPDSRPSVGCAGAGVLGSAIMERLVDSGFEVSVWNRTTDKLAPLVDRGARLAESPEDLAHGADVLLTCLLDGDTVERVVFGERGIAAAGGPDKLLVDMSTADAAQTREMARRLREQCQMGWLDAPISGGAPAARAGTMTVMAGGSEADLERARPVLDALAARCTLMGPNGAGQTTKMINQVLVSTGFAVLAEACALAERAGVDATRIPEAIEGGRADSRLLQEFLPRMAASEFSVEGRIAVMVKDLDMIRDLARSVGAPMPVTAAVAELNRTAMARGLGERDNAELVRLHRDDEPA